MVGRLLVRGMLVGIVAGLLSFAFLKVVGEPQVDRAVSFETQMDEARDKAKADEAMAKGMAMPKEDPEPQLVSRQVQAGLGLFTGVEVYCVAFGGLFALAFAVCYGRVGGLGPRASSAVLSAAGFVSVYVVPTLKYPANPPSVGDPETIGIRTGLYFSMIAISLIAMVASGKLRLLLIDRLGGWNAALVAGGFYIAAILMAGVVAARYRRSPGRVSGRGSVEVQGGVARGPTDHVGFHRPAVRDACRTPAGPARARKVRPCRGCGLR